MEEYTIYLYGSCNHLALSIRNCYSYIVYLPCAPPFASLLMLFFTNFRSFRLNFARTPYSLWRADSLRILASTAPHRIRYYKKAPSADILCAAYAKHENKLAFAVCRSSAPSALSFAV